MDFPNAPPPGEIASRIRALAARIDGRLDAALISHPTDLQYFAGTTQDATLVVRASGDAVLLARKSFSRARAESPVADVRELRSIRDIVAIVAPTGRAVRVGACLDVWPAAMYRRVLDALPAGSVAGDISADAKRLRAVKSEWEIACVRAAAAQADAAFAHVREMIAPGVTEIDLSVEVESLVRRLGHDGHVRLRKPGSWLHILYVSAAESAATPSSFDGPVGSAGLHAWSSGAGRRALREGETVMVDMVTNHLGYHADDARVFAVGEPGAQVRMAHEWCRAAMRELSSRLVPGAAFRDIYDTCARIFAERGEPEGFMGFGENRVRFFGHGVGLELDEWPVIAPGFDGVVEPGMVIAIEPKALSPTIGPAGIENTCLVTESGVVSLCTAPEDL